MPAIIAACAVAISFGVAFQFVKATNLKSDKDMHMRSATFTFVDKDTLKTEWSSFQDGKEKEKMAMELKRKK